MKKHTNTAPSCLSLVICLLMLTVVAVLLVACTPAGDGGAATDTAQGSDTPASVTEAPTAPAEETTALAADTTTPAEETTAAPESETIDMSHVPATVEERWFVYRIWNFNLTPYETFTATVDAAVDAGFNAIKVHIPWASAQPTAAAPDYAAYDRLVDYVVREKGIKVAISLDLTRRAEDALVGEEHIQRDPAGKLCVGGYPGDNRTVISFCSDYAVDLAVKFYADAVAHYHERYGDAVLFYLPAFNPYCETEYWAVGDYDYSPVAKEAFAAFLQAEFGTVEAMNQALGQNYADFVAVTPPATTDTSALGLLWYRFRHENLKAVIDALAKAQEQVAPGAKFSVQFGSVFDSAIARRATVAFTALCEHADVVWVDDGPAYPHAFSMDYIRSALPAHVEIANEIDGPSQTNATPENYLDQGLTSYAHGATYVSIANWSIDEKFEAYRPVWREIADTWLGVNPPPVLSVAADTPVVEVTLLNALKRGTDRYTKLHAQAGGHERFVFIRITDDLSNVKVTKPTEAYSFPGSFSDTQGKDNWYYRDYRRGEFSDMTYHADGHWQGAAQFTRVMNGSVHPDSYDAAIVFKVPHDGKLDFSYQLTVVSNQSDGIKYTILLNGEPAEGFDERMTLLAPEDSVSATLTLTVSAGDEVALIVNRNKTNTSDTTAVFLSAEYTD